MINPKMAVYYVKHPQKNCFAFIEIYQKRRKTEKLLTNFFVRAIMATKLNSRIKELIEARK